VRRATRVDGEENPRRIYLKAMLLRNPRYMELIDLSVPMVRPGEVLFWLDGCSVNDSDLEPHHGLH
jgi:hypothetical protein